MNLYFAFLHTRARAGTFLSVCRFFTAAVWSVRLLCGCRWFIL